MDRLRARRRTKPHTGDHAIARRLFCLVRRSTEYEHELTAAYRLRTAATQEFLRRFEGNLDYSGAKVLDYGCGLGSTCMELMRTGAAQVVGVDVDPARIAFARYRLLEHAPELADRVDFRVIRDVDDVEDGPFNLILSQDTFQVIEQPERTAKALVERLGPRGEIAIGISPLWNAPSGGLVDDVSWLPWAQLIFPEKVIVEESGRAFDDNRMSLEHFLAMMKRTGLEQRHLAFNVRPQRMGRAILVLDVLRALPVSALRELMTLSVYGIWRRPS